jgi:hypothetical protein
MPKQKERQQEDPRALAERRLVLRDLKDNVFRASVVPAAYSLEEYAVGLCRFKEYRLRVIKLQEDEVGAEKVSCCIVNVQHCELYMFVAVAAVMAVAVYGCVCTNLCGISPRLHCTAAKQALHSGSLQSLTT